ncbi:MAG TPA: septal ring lytic transglycosylase RlpA family protein, partial [Trichormus sp.]
TFRTALAILISVSASSGAFVSYSCSRAMAIEDVGVEDAAVEDATDAAKDAAKEVAPNFSGVADYYADFFHGKRTASGQLHDKNKLTAAHRSLPFGTKVKLVNRRNKRSCIVVINDRGPFTKNKIIDVSQEAARKLGLFSAGSRMVDCYVVQASGKESL